MKKHREIIWRAAAAFVAGALFFTQPYVTMAAGKTAGASRVEEMVALLPESGSVEEKDAQNVMDAMEAYWALTMAEQVSVDPEAYKKLDDDYRACVVAGYVEDAEKKAEKEKEEQERAAREQAALELSGTTEADATRYVFELTEREPAASILIRFTLDINGDGNGDPPERITLTSPTGDPYVLSQKKVSEEEDGLYIMYQWQPSYVQIDIAQAPEGKWMVETSEPAGFTKMTYAGIRKEIEPADKEKEEDAENTENTEGEEEIQPEEEQSGPNIMSFLIVILLAGVFAFMFFMIRFKPFEKKDGDGDDEGEGNGRVRKRATNADNDEDFAKPASEEEVARQMRKEFLEQQEEELRAEASADEDEDEDDYDDVGNTEDDTDEDDDDGYFEYNEGESGLLRAQDSPFGRGGGLREDDETEPLEEDDEDDEDFFDSDM